MRRYKDTFVGKGSTLSVALEKSDKDAKKVYDETTAAFVKLYGVDDATWFVSKHKERT